MGEYLIRQTVQRKSFEFALSVIRLYKKLQARQEFILSPQLLKSGTGIGVSVEEAIAEPNRDMFIDRVMLASRSARETRYWLKLLQESKLVDVDVSGELVQIDDLLNLLSHLTPDS